MRFRFLHSTTWSASKKILIGSAFLISSFTIQAQNNIKTTEQVLSAETVGFFENKGQITNQHGHQNSEVLYLLNSPGLKLQLRKGGFSYDTYIADGTESLDLKPFPLFQDATSAEAKQESRYNFHRVDVELENINPDVIVLSEYPSQSYFNFFPGDGGKGITRVRHYQKVTYQNIYHQIDLVFKYENGKPEYDFVVHPGGNVEDIVLHYKGMKEISQTSEDELTISVNHGSFKDIIPLSYEREINRKVQVSYSLSTDHKVSFTAHDYNKNHTLVIDPAPTLLWGSYYGGSVLDFGLDIALDPSGNILLTGQTNSLNNVATSGAYQTTFGSSYNCYIAKVSSDGTQLLWGTYYRGTNEGRAIASDANGNVLVAGTSGVTADNLSTTLAHQTFNAGSSDAFVAKFSPDGTQLLWGTYYGGPQNDGAYDVTVDGNNNVLITGYTRSSTLIASTGAYQTVNNSPAPYFNAFVAKFNPFGSWMWGTYYGGTVNDQGIAITTDVNDNPIIVGIAQSSGIATPGAYQTTLRGNSNTFLAKLKADGSQLLWSTYYGGTGNVTYAADLVRDNAGNIFITGYTDSPNFISTTGTHATVLSGGYDTYLAKFNSDGSQLLWGTYYGGPRNAFPYGITLDPSGNPWITGTTIDTTGIATSDALQLNYKASNDTYLAKFSPDGTQLLWGTYFSVPYQDEGHGIVSDASGNIIITGFSGGYVGDTDLSTPSGFKPGNSGYGDAYVAKFSNGGCVANAGVISALQDSVCAGTPAHLTSSGFTGNIQWQSSLSSVGFVNISGATDSSYTAPVAQTTYFRAYVENGNCSDTSEIFQLITHPLPIPFVSANDTLICSGDSTRVDCSGSFSAYQWNNGDNRSYTYAGNAGGIWVTVTDSNGCAGESNHHSISVYPVTPISIVVQGDTLSSFNGTSYQWYRNDTLITGATSAVFVANRTGYYSLEIIDNNGCRVRSSQVFVIISGLEELSENYPFRVYPNPFNQVIEVESSFIVSRFELADVLGRVCIASNFAGSSIKINTSMLPGGVYYLKISLGQIEHVKKLIKP